MGVGAATTTLEWAIAYHERGWAPIPVRLGTKVPYLEFRAPGPRLLEKWRKQVIPPDELRRHFGKNAPNVGILLGYRSGGLVDVDLDDPRSVALAAGFLPSTLTFGRPGKPSSHWLYVVDQWVGRRTFGRLHEIRGDRCMTVFPPSRHESGDVIAWDDYGTEPVRIDLRDLRERMHALRVAVKEAGRGE